LLQVKEYQLLYAQEQVIITGKNKFTFKITGSPIIWDDYLRMYKSKEEEKKEATAQLPACKIITYHTGQHQSQKHLTQAPPRL
jgi:DNA topoisomerase IA